MSLYYLNTENFKIEQSPNGMKHLTIDVNGPTLVMFTSKDCKICDRFLPEYRNMVGSVNGLTFGLCGVDDGNRRIIGMSRNSSTPIKAVPRFIFYNNGVPFSVYEGPKIRSSIMKFIQEMSQQIPAQASFSNQPRSRQQPRPQQPQQTPQQQTPQQRNESVRINQSTGVKEYETSYGRPYNINNDDEFLAYEKAYKQTLGKY